jgi:signal peptidase II
VRRVRSQTLKHKAVALLVAAVVVAFDQITKAWALHSIPPGTAVDVIPGVLRLKVYENQGVAFSMFQNAGTILVIAIIIAVVVILFALRSSESWWQSITLGLVLGGAVGNLVDRFARGSGFLNGRVVDWIEPSFFATFNVADASITMGVILLLIASARRS